LELISERLEPERSVVKETPDEPIASLSEFHGQWIDGIMRFKNDARFIELPISNETKQWKQPGNTSIKK
jgi:hypothetical protein